MSDKQYYNISGRQVQGDIFVPQTTNMTGGPLTDLKGNPKVQYFIGVAVAKNAPDFDPAWAAMNAVAAQDFPGGESQRADFSWKMVDGDLPENASKEGFPGHWVFRFTSGFPWQAVAQGGVKPITNPEEIKKGYYIRVFFTIAGNKNTTKPGIYLNGAVVELLGVGPVITSGPDAAGLINTAAPAPVIPGMQATPVSPPVAQPGMVAPPAPQPQMAASPVVPVVQPGLPATPGLPAQPAPVAQPGTVIPPNPAILGQ